MLEMFEFIMQWPAPSIALFIWALHVKIGKCETTGAVLEAQIASDKLAHGNEIKDVAEVLRIMVSKLDSFEVDLRKRRSIKAVCVLPVERVIGCSVFS